MAIELRLNPRKPGNYAFFCPITKLHLTLTNPVGITDRVSVYIVRAIKAKTIIDVNNVVNLETGEVIGAVTTKKTKTEPVKSTTAPTQDQKEKQSQEVEVVADEKKVKKAKKSNKQE